MEAAQVDVDFIQVPLLEAGSGRRSRAKRSSDRKFKEKQRGGAERPHLQQQGVDAFDARLGDGRQEVVFYSEGERQVLAAEDVPPTPASSHLLLCGMMTNVTTSAAPIPNPTTRTWTRSLPAQADQSGVRRQEEANTRLTDLS